MLPSDDTAADEVGSFENAHVFGRGGEGHAEGGGEFAEVAFSSGELPGDRAPGGVRQGVEDMVEPRGPIDNHMV